MKKRTFENPVFSDKATLLKSSEETGGEYTLFEIEVAAGGGNSLHSHPEFTEKFTVRDGELTVLVSGEERRLGNHQSAIVPAGASHCFRNNSQASAKFLVELRPGQPGFEKSIAIAYGLATDGLVNKLGAPRNFSYLSILVKLSGTVPAGMVGLLMPLFGFVSKLSKKTERSLIEKYC